MSAEQLVCFNKLHSPLMGIFAAMKRYGVAILLPILFILVFVNASFVSIETVKPTSSIDKRSEACFNAHFHIPDSELERSNRQTHTGFAYQGIQKIPGYLTENLAHLLISSLVYPSTTFSKVELFDNNYLSYNYPSHNFW